MTLDVSAKRISKLERTNLKGEQQVRNVVQGSLIRRSVEMEASRISTANTCPLVSTLSMTLDVSAKRISKLERTNLKGEQQVRNVVQGSLIRRSVEGRQIMGRLRDENFDRRRGPRVVSAEEEPKVIGADDVKMLLEVRRDVEFDKGRNRQQERIISIDGRLTASKMGGKPVIAQRRLVCGESPVTIPVPRPEEVDTNLRNVTAEP
ncbi:hypothetical protein R3P38DRAFT_3355578 [Favolaschia claudopus]|uniref:Uncharacterized protein n=1 Tax=Favolaschia claudopus TaxID=2862362 RepID=A0AAW0BL89_9AGAR